MKNKSIAQLLTGLLVLALGVGFLLDGLNILDFSHYIKDFWPLAIIAVGFVSLVANPRLFLWPLVIMTFGVLFLLQQLGVLTFNVWHLVWPTVIIIVGLSLIFDRAGGLGRKPQDVGDDSPKLFVAFSGQNARSVSQDFKGGSATAIFGGIQLDLRGAQIKQKATLDVFAAFGGIELRVPEEWAVAVSGAPLFGGWENKTKYPADKDAPVLHIRGTCLFGGVDIKN